jgi:hypothetical protein
MTGVQVETLARAFHDAYERLAPDFGYETREETRQFDPESPNGRLMCAVVEAVVVPLLLELNHPTGHHGGDQK